MVGINPLEDPWTAYCFDEAVHIWGTHVESEVHEATRKEKKEDKARAKAKSVIERLMQSDETPRRSQEPPPIGRNAVPAESIEVSKVIENAVQEIPPPPKGKFRDPASMFGK